MGKPTRKGEKEKKMISMVLLLFLFNTHLMVCKGAALVIISGGEGVVGGCKGKVGECLWEEQGSEMEMDSEANRRVLWAAPQKKYISYEALKGDVVPCTRPGVPYYNCHALPKANPYSRGCSVITGCARGMNP